MKEVRRPMRHAALAMNRGSRWVASLTAATLGIFLFGFILFAAQACRGPQAFYGQADGIVVLTGGELRIMQAARLLSEGRARRLLVSGVNSRIARQDVLRLTGLRPDQFDCCVDVGYIARDTIGNAEEARDWAETWGFKKLIVVTGSYHMPRSLIEMGRALPDAELVPYPVVPPSLSSTPWWLNPSVARRLFGEYVKFLPSAALSTATRLARWGETALVVVEPAPAGPKA